jgi:D-glycero-D-manno-heptose 1,7-bisphosphate phosphatase
LSKEAIISGRQQAVFLDRDGVLNRPVVRYGKPYPPLSLDDFVILPDVPEALARLSERGFQLYVVTNQPDVARGTQQRSVVEAMHDTLQRVLPISGFYVCYHDDQDECDCRKPKPGLLLKAAVDHSISLPDSYMIGDRWRDIDCGHAAGCTTIFIDKEYTESLRKEPDFRAADMFTAAAIITSLKGQ